MDLTKTKIISIWQRARSLFPFLSLSGRKSAPAEEDLDRKLVYNLSPRKIPDGNQLKHLKKFLNPREYLIIKICLLVIAINLAYLGVNYVREHLQYSPVSGGEYIEGVVGYPQTINPL